jgi:hypothetical protein
MGSEKKEIKMAKKRFWMGMVIGALVFLFFG